MLPNGLKSFVLQLGVMRGLGKLCGSIFPSMTPGPDEIATCSRQ